MRPTSLHVYHDLNEDFYCQCFHQLYGLGLNLVRIVFWSFLWCCMEAKSTGNRGLSCLNLFLIL